MQNEPGLIEQTAREMLRAGMTWQEAARRLQKEWLTQSLRDHRGNICHVARALRMHRNTVSRMLHDLELEKLPRQIRDEYLQQRSLVYQRVQFLRDVRREGRQQKKAA